MPLNSQTCCCDFLQVVFSPTELPFQKNQQTATLMELLHLPTPQYLLRVALLQQRDRSPHLQSARSAQNTQNTQPSKMCRTPLRHSTTRTCSRIRYFAPLLLFYSSTLLLFYFSVLQHPTRFTGLLVTMRMSSEDSFSFLL